MQNKKLQKYIDQAQQCCSKIDLAYTTIQLASFGIVSFVKHVLTLE